MRSFLALIFRLLFKINYLKYHFFGLQKRAFIPLNLFKGVSKTITYKNLRLVLLIDDWIQQIIYFLGDYEKAELGTLNLFLKQDSLFIDIGANFGLYTLNASKIIGKDGGIISFEPFSDNFKALNANILSNSLTNIKAEQMALGAKTETINMYYDASENNLGMVTMKPLKNVQKVEVAMTTLDTYLISNTITKKIDLIKIDVEGFEYDVLLGMQQTLKTHNPAVLIEILDESSHTNSKKIHAYFKKHNYQKFYIDDNSTLLKHQKNTHRKNYIFIKKTN